jgi:hypothetical protein
MPGSGNGVRPMRATSGGLYVYQASRQPERWGRRIVPLIPPSSRTLPTSKSEVCQCGQVPGRSCTTSPGTTGSATDDRAMPADRRARSRRDSSTRSSSEVSTRHQMQRLKICSWSMDFSQIGLKTTIYGLHLGKRHGSWHTDGAYWFPRRLDRAFALQPGPVRLISAKRHKRTGRQRALKRAGAYTPPPGKIRGQKNTHILK